MNRMIPISVSIAALIVSGCSTPSDSQSPTKASDGSSTLAVAATAFEGSWKGHEVTPGHEGPATLTVSGQTLEFHGSGDDDWVKATFTVRDDTAPKQLAGVVTECAAPEQIGKKTYAIYKIEDGTLTISGNGLGDPDFPATFDAPGSRQFVFKHAQ